MEGWARLRGTGLRMPPGCHCGAKVVSARQEGMKRRARGCVCLSELELWFSPHVPGPMPNRLRTGLLLVAALVSLAQDASGQGRWFKGNTHAHSLNSDGDVPVDEVIRWFRE